MNMLDEFDRGRFYYKVLTHFSKQHQVLKTMEECGELVQALAKWTNNPSTENRANVLEEMADVRIMLEQMAIVFPDDDHAYFKKLTRLQDMMVDK